MLIDNNHHIIKGISSCLFLNLIYLTKKITKAIINKAKSAPLFTLCNTKPLIVSTSIIKLTPTE